MKDKQQVYVSADKELVKRLKAKGIKPSKVAERALHQADDRLGLAASISALLDALLVLETADCAPEHRAHLFALARGLLSDLDPEFGLRKNAVQSFKKTTADALKQ